MLDTIIHTAIGHTPDDRKAAEIAEAFKPLTMQRGFLIADLARTFDVSPREVLRELAPLGLPTWHEGTRIEARDLDGYLRREHWTDPAGELECNLDFGQAARLCEAFGVEVDSIWECRS